MSTAHPDREPALAGVVVREQATLENGVRAQRDSVFPGN